MTEITFPPKPPVNNGTSTLDLASTWNLGAAEDEWLSEDDLVLLEKLKAFGVAAQSDMSGFKGM